MSESTLSGKLADSKGRPVGGIRVWVYKRKEWTGRGLHWPWQDRFEGFKASAMSGQDGNFGPIKDIPIPEGLGRDKYGVCTEPTNEYPGKGGAKIFRAGVDEVWNATLFGRGYLEKAREWWKFLKWW